MVLKVLSFTLNFILIFIPFSQMQGVESFESCLQNDTHSPLKHLPSSIHSTPSSIGSASGQLPCLPLNSKFKTKKFKKY